MKNKKIYIAITIIILIILLFPLKEKYYDGGSIEYKSLTYKLVKYHKITEELEEKYIEGIKLDIFKINVLNTIDEEKINPKVLTISSKSNSISMSRGTNSIYFPELEIGIESDTISPLEFEYNESLISKKGEQLIIENLIPYQINNIEIYSSENKEKLSFEIEYNEESQTIKAPENEGNYILILECQSSHIKSTYSFKLETQ